MKKSVLSLMTLLMVTFFTVSYTHLDRLIYDIYEEKVTVLVLTVEGHYDDK